MTEKTSTTEIGFSASAYSKEGLHINKAIDIMCYQLLDIEETKISKEKRGFFHRHPFFRFFAPKTNGEKKLLAKALKEIAKTPTGRMAIWATIHDLTYNPDTKTYAVDENNTGYNVKKFVETGTAGNGNILGFVRFDSPYEGNEGNPKSKPYNTVHVLIKEIEKNVRKRADEYKKNKTLPPEALTEDAIKQAILLDIADTFLHEFQHSRQGYFISKRYYELYGVYPDAAPQSFSHQIHTEAMSPLLAKMYNVPQKDIDDYKKAVHYNEKTGEFDVKLATLYSQIMQQRQTFDFASPLSKQPYTDYSRLDCKWRWYIANCVDFIKPNPSAKVKKAMHDYFIEANRVDVKVGEILPEKLKQIFTPLIQDVKKHLSADEIEYLEQCMNNRKKLDPKKFKGGKNGIAYKKAMAFFEPYLDVSMKLLELSELSARIKSGDKTALKRSSVLKAELKEYGFVFHTHNRMNERISEMAVERKERTLAQAGDTLPSEVQPETQGLNTLRESQTEVSTPLSPSKERLT